MNEMDELKKKIYEIFQILGRLVNSNFHWNQGAPSNADSFLSQKRIWIAAGILFSFLLGFLAGPTLMMGGPLAGVGNRMGRTGEEPSLLYFVFQKEIVVPGKQADGSFVFSNFETPKDLKAWQTVASHVELSSKHLSSGKQSAQVTFYGGGDVSAFTLEDYFSSRRGKKNWSNDESFCLYIYNPRSETERLILQIKDQKGNRFKEDLHVPGGSGKEFSVPITRISGSINIRAIDQLSVFRWEPKSDLDFYFDDIRLVPKGFQKKPELVSKPSVPVKERPVKMLDYGFLSRKPAWLVLQSGEADQTVRVPFIVKNETAALVSEMPVGGGIPFPMGELKSPDFVQIRDGAGKAAPFQSRVLSRWPDHSVKWLAVHFETTIPPTDGAGYFLEYGPNIRPQDFGGNLSWEEKGDAFHINTGVMQVELSKQQFYLFKGIFLDQNQNGIFEPNEKMVSDAPLTLSFRGEEYRADLDRKTYRLEVEEKGSRRIVLKASGWFQSQSGKRFCEAVVRYYLYQGKSFIKVNHTLIYTGYPENKYYDKYKGLKLPPNEPIESFGIRLPYQFSNGSAKDRVRFGTGGNRFDEFLGGETFRLYQSDFDHISLERNQAATTFSDSAAGWMDVSSGTSGISVAMRHFREQFPKAFSVDRNQSEIQIDLWPKEAGELDLATTSNALGPEDRARGNAFGLAKTHELFFYVHREDPKVQATSDVADSFMKPLILRVNPYWVDATGALGRLFPVSPRFGTEEKMLEELFDWAARHPVNFKWYGMVNFGDTLSWWRHEDEEQDYEDWGWHPVGRWGWYNCEGVGLHTGALLQFIRSGEWKYFEFGENLARHIMDVDTVHYNTIANDPRLKNVLNNEVSKVGSMHRHSGDHWSGRNEESSHTSVVGILLYHYLTGDERAMDVAKEIGGFFLAEPFTYTGHPDVAPHRAMANALWGDVLLFEATGDVRYKKAADRIIEIYLRGQQTDGSFLENYNPLDDTWSGSKHQDYMESYALGAMIAYHELTQDEEVKGMLLKMIHYLGTVNEAVASLHGFAYGYFITGDFSLIDTADKRLNGLLAQRQTSSDPMMNGLIYQKPIYHRPNAFLYSTPYVFEAIEAAGSLKR